MSKFGANFEPYTELKTQLSDDVQQIKDGKFTAEVGRLVLAARKNQLKLVDLGIQYSRITKGSAAQ